MRNSFIILTLCLLTVIGITNAAEKKPVNVMEIGDPAPDFNLPGVDGKNYKLSDFDDADILTVIFTCNHCPTAQGYEPMIKQIAAEYKSKGVAFVVISPNDPKAVRLDELGYTDVSDSFEDMKIRAAFSKFDFPYLYDGDKQEVSRAYGPIATPHVFIFDRERKLRYTGRVADAENIKEIKSPDTRAALDALLEGKPVPKEKTKAFGCSIKWAEKRGSVQESLDKWAKEEVSVEKIGEEEVKALIKNDSDKLRMINVWATWCGPCVAEFPELVTINRMYRRRPFELIAISADSPNKEENVLSFLKEQQASFKNYQFNNTDIYKLIDAVDPEWQGAIPYTLLIKSDGEIVYRKMGAIDPLEVKQKIVAIIGRTY